MLRNKTPYMKLHTRTVTHTHRDTSSFLHHACVMNRKLRAPEEQVTLGTIDPRKVKVQTEAALPLLQDTLRHCEASVLELDSLCGAS